jgi:hypothetical protein
MQRVRAAAALKLEVVRLLTECNSASVAAFIGDKRGRGRFLRDTPCGINSFIATY